MNEHIPAKSVVAVPLALVALTLTGCPETTLKNGPVGPLRVVQTIVAADDTAVNSVLDLVVGPDGKHVYVSDSSGADLGTFDRSEADGSLERRYSNATSPTGGARLSMTPDGKHLYSSGSLIIDFQIDAATGEPIPHVPPDIMNGGGELAVAGGGAVLYVGLTLSVSSYLIGPTPGDLAPGPEASLDPTTMLPVSLFADDAHGALFVFGNDHPPGFIVKYGVNAATGALTEKAKVQVDVSGTDLGGTFSTGTLSLCGGTTRMYIPLEGGSIGYADVAGGGIGAVSAGFTHTDLANIIGVQVSIDCKNVYAVTWKGSRGAVVVLARDERGDLSHLQTISTGAGTSLVAITQPAFVRESPDGKNLYLGSTRPGEGIVVFQRDTTGAGF